MPEITISLTEEQEKFLKLFAQNHYPGAKDNVCTNNPLHLVQTREERVVDPDYDEPDKIKYRTVAIFFILEEAKKYIKYQGHNLSNPRTYTVSAGYSNKGEYHHFWELLFDMGKRLNEEGGDTDAKMRR
jgi:hypothetical protein